MGGLLRIHIFGGGYWVIVVDWAFVGSLFG